MATLTNILPSTAKTTAATFRGGPKVRHADTGKDKKRKGTREGVKGEGVWGVPAHDAAGPNRPVNNTPFGMQRFAGYLDSMAAEHAAQFGINKSEAYDALLKNDPAFKLIWKAALTLPAE